MSLKFFLQSKKNKKPTSDAAHIIKFCRSYKVVKAGLTVSVLEGFLILGYRWFPIIGHPIIGVSNYRRRFSTA